MSLIGEYDSAVTALATDPHNQDLQHKAVLSLARAGSLDFAQTEFIRYGLDEVRHHENIQGLGGRLQKDLYLASSGEAAQNYARRSYELYEQAYIDTKGHYSGINAATMAMLAGEPGDAYRDMARKLLAEIPEMGLSSNTKYYIEATRAEAYLLLQDMELARAAMCRAWDHDPLNYRAHASTLKQFELIHSAFNSDASWMSSFEPPKPAHFAGHIFGSLSKGPNLPVNALDLLEQQISEVIQARDIGFGYGALAAGSDIMIAEGLLQEGAELHVILPVEKDLFKAKSVSAFGPEWGSRFEACLSSASSLEIVSSSKQWPNAGLDGFAGCIAMGRAIMRARHLSVSAEQLLISDRQEGRTGTAAHASIWKTSGCSQNIVPFKGSRATKTPVPSSPPARDIVLAVKGQDKYKFFINIESAVTQAAKESAGAGLAVGLIDYEMDPSNLARQLAAKAVPGGILMSEAFACHLALHVGSAFTGDYMGRLSPKMNAPRMFALKAKSAFE